MMRQETLAPYLTFGEPKNLMQFRAIPVAAD
jgi:hypothetical protein